MLSGPEENARALQNADIVSQMQEKLTDMTMDLESKALLKS